jgi:hypothetical protein
MPDKRPPPDKRHPEVHGRTAYDLKDLHRQLADLFTDDELQQIPVVPPGSRLEQGSTYVDLRDPARREFKARADMVADDYHWYVPKHAVPYELWDRLVGKTDPERVGTPPER